MLNLFFTLLFGCHSWAGGTVIDGGGGGVVVGNNVYLLDFFEAGIHKKPFIDSRPPALMQNLIRENRRDFDPVSDETLRLVFGKIEDVASRDPVLAAFIEKAMLSIHWNFSPEEILTTSDIETCTLNIKSIQLALRQGSIVNVSLKMFMKMDSANQAGLIFHEALQSLAPQIPVDVCRHRRAVSLLFTSSFLKADLGFWNSTLKSYPTAYEATKLYGQIKNSIPSGGHYFSRKGLRSPLWGGSPDNEISDVGLTDISDWLLFPFVNLSFVGGREFLGQNIFENFGFERLCAANDLFKSFSLNFQQVYLTPRFNEKGEAVARFDWSLKERVFTVWHKGSGTDLLAPCEVADTQFLNSFDIWKRTVRFFQIQEIAK